MTRFPQFRWRSRLHRLFRTELQLWDVLTDAERARMARLAGMSVVGAVLEAVGVGLVVPVIAVVVNPGVIRENTTACRLLPAELLASDSGLVVSVLGLLLLVTTVRTGYLTFLFHRQSAFTRDVETSLSSRLLRLYLNQPWSFHALHNSSVLLRNVRHEVSTVGFVASAAQTVVTDGALLLGIVGILLLLEPLPTMLVAALIGGLGITYQFSMRTRVAIWGERRQQLEGQRIQQLQEGLAAVRELRLAGATSVFADVYSRDTRAHLATVQRHWFASQLPRLLFDLLATVALVSAIGMLMLFGERPADTIPAVGLYAAAATRILPSANKLLGALQLIRWGSPSVSVVHEEFVRLRNPPPQVASASLPDDADIHVCSVTYRYPGSSVPALVDVSMRMPVGSMTGIIGASGSGKSTLLDIVLGLLPPDAGQVLAGREDIRGDLAGWHRRIGYVPQTIYLFDDSLRKNVALGVEEESIDDEAVWKALRAASLGELVATWPKGLETRLGERGARLSGGQRQRIGIARALYSDPKLLVLDEATSALDADTEAEVMSSILELRGNRTVVIVAHRLSTVSQCDYVWKLERGRVVSAGSFDQVVGAQGGG